MIRNVTSAASKLSLLPQQRAANRSLKQREREVPEIDWERSLQHYAAAVCDDLDKLVARFLEEVCLAVLILLLIFYVFKFMQSDITFAAWKRLWIDSRMSAAFHVEFWESSPTSTHKIILQQTLDALVNCVEEHNAAYGNLADIMPLIGRIFALYSAYSVQLGVPKHKIEVDPQKWLALVTINYIICGSEAALFLTAVREVKAIMHHLVVKEKAFLSCLQGFWPSVRVQTAKSCCGRRGLPLVVGNVTEEDHVSLYDTLKQLKALHSRYQQLMSQVSTLEFGSVSRLCRCRDTPALSANKRSIQEGDYDDNRLPMALKSYIEHIANRKTHKVDDVVVHAAAARKYNDMRRTSEQAYSERDGIKHQCDAIVAYKPRRSMVKPSSSIQPNWGRSDDFMAQLEFELRNDIYNEQVETETELVIRDKNESLFSRVDSDRNSKLVAVRERPLEQIIGAVPSWSGRPSGSADVLNLHGRKRVSADEVFQTLVNTVAPRRLAVEQGSYKQVNSEADSGTSANLQKEQDLNNDLALFGIESTVSESAMPLCRGKRRRDTATIGISQKKVARTALLKQNSAHIDKLPDCMSAESEVNLQSILESSLVGSTANNSYHKVDQTEGSLDATPLLTLAQCPIALIPNETKLTRRTSSRGESQLSNVFDAPVPHCLPYQPVENKVAHSNKLTTQLKGNVGVSTSVLIKRRLKTSACKKSPASNIKTRKSSQLNSEVSESDGDALKELERELNETAAALGAAQSINTSLAQEVKYLPAHISNANKQRLNIMGTPSTADAGLMSTSKIASKQRARKLYPMSPQTPPQVSSILSDHASDGFEDFATELKQAQKYSAVKRKPNLSSKRRSSRLHNRSAVTKVMPSVSAPLRLVVPTTPIVSIGARHSARSSSVASDSESDDLKKLIAELDNCRATFQPSGLRIAKVKAQLRTARRHQTQTVHDKVKQPQKKKTQKTKRPSRAQQPHTKLKSARPSTHLSGAPMNPPSPRLSASTAFESDSDGLIHLNAELLAGLTK